VRVTYPRIRRVATFARISLPGSLRDNEANLTLLFYICDMDKCHIVQICGGELHLVVCMIRKRKHVVLLDGDRPVFVDG
jgi:hypothetical protein